MISFLRNHTGGPSVRIALGFLTLLVLAAAFGPALGQADPYQIDAANLLSSPTSTICAAEPQPWPPLSTPTTTTRPSPSRRHSGRTGRMAWFIPASAILVVSASASSFPIAPPT